MKIVIIALAALLSSSAFADISYTDAVQFALSIDEVNDKIEGRTNDHQAPAKSIKFYGNQESVKIVFIYPKCWIDVIIYEDEYRGRSLDYRRVRSNCE